MATKKAATKKSTSLIPWDEKFAKAAAVGIASVANIGSAIKQIKFGRGTIAIGDTVIKTGKIEVIIVGGVGLNRWNKDAYDADNPMPPDCYAFSLIVDDKEMKPHAAAPDKQSEDCVTCDQNVYGSARVGDGKACNNTVRMGLLIGKDVEDEESVAKAELYLGNVSPTNLKYYSAYLKWVYENQGKRPLWAVITEISSFDDPKTQIRLEFKMLELIDDDDILLALEKRAEKMTEELMKPFSASTGTKKKPESKGSANKRFAPKKAVAKGKR